jgi:hypothetical protein
MTTYLTKTKTTYVNKPPSKTETGSSDATPMNESNFKIDGDVDKPTTLTNKNISHNREDVNLEYEGEFPDEDFDDYPLDYNDIQEDDVAIVDSYDLDGDSSLDYGVDLEETTEIDDDLDGYESDMDEVDLLDFDNVSAYDGESYMDNDASSDYDGDMSYAC